MPLGSKPLEPRGVLHLREPAAMPGYGRFRPAAELEPFVEHYWTVAWDLVEPVVRELLPHPSLNLSFEEGSAGAVSPRIVGVHTGRFTRRLAGRGRVLSVKFRPGGFRPWLGRSVSELTDREVPAAGVFGDEVVGVAERVLATPDPAVALEELDAYLRAERPDRDETAELAGRIVERAAVDRALLRVEQLAEAAGLGVRRLQRLFADCVGVSPKWVLQRYRLHEAVERIAGGGEIDWADLALDLGYADQAHFIRDFRRLVGRTPAEYERTLE